MAVAPQLDDGPGVSGHTPCWLVGIVKYPQQVPNSAGSNRYLFIKREEGVQCFAFNSQPDATLLGKPSSLRTKDGIAMEPQRSRSLGYTRIAAGW